MLYRLVRPMKRQGSSKQHFVKRIPADVKGRMVGMKLAIPIGDERTIVAVTDKMQAAGSQARRIVGQDLGVAPWRGA
jgi:hypothetical protein